MPEKIKQDGIAKKTRGEGKESETDEKRKKRVVKPDTPPSTT